VRYVWRWPQARTNTGCGFCFCPAAAGFQSIKTKNRTAVTRSGWAASGVKCKWDCAVAKQLQKNDGGDTDSPAASATRLEHQ